MEVRYRYLATATAVIFPLLTAMYFTGKRVVAAASRAPVYFEGIHASGAVLKEKDSPVVLEKEKLDLKISSLPREGKTDLSMIDLSTYDAQATTEYTFYNPTALDETMTLFTPFGVFPDYVPSGADDTTTAVAVNAEGAECKVRYTYAAYSSYEFEVEKEAARICDEKKTDFFYSEDMPVTKYSLLLDVPQTNETCTLKIKLGFNPQKTRVLFPFESDTRLCVTDGDMYASCYLREAGEKTFVFYAAGDALWEIRDSMYDGTTEVPRIRSMVKTETTFSEFVLSERKEAQVGDVDWYNAFLDMLNERSGKEGSVDGFRLDRRYLLRWYEYDVTVPAQDRVVGSVSVPLFPSFSGAKNIAYAYSYRLSPAFRWTGRPKIEINIRTPYYLSNSSLEFKKNVADGEFSYSLSRDTLPQGELTFVLTEKQTGDPEERTKNFLFPSITWALVTLVILAAIAAIVTVVVVLSLRKKK